MPAFETMDRRDPAVYWRVTGVDEFNEPIRSDPCQLMINWSPMRRVQRFPDGTTAEIEGTANVDRTMVLGDIVWIGRFKDFDEAAIPATNPLLRVVMYKEDNDIKGRHVFRTVTLARFHRSLPTKG